MQRLLLLTRETHCPMLLTTLTNFFVANNTHCRITGIHLTSLRLRMPRCMFNYRRDTMMQGYNQELLTNNHATIPISIPLCYISVPIPLWWRHFLAREIKYFIFFCSEWICVITYTIQRKRTAIITNTYKQRLFCFSNKFFFTFCIIA
jgi:hypothetical protein